MCIKSMWMDVYCGHLQQASIKNTRNVIKRIHEIKIKLTNAATSEDKSATSSSIIASSACSSRDIEEGPREENGEAGRERRGKWENVFGMISFARISFPQHTHNTHTHATSPKPTVHTTHQKLSKEKNTMSSSRSGLDNISEFEPIDLPCFRDRASLIKYFCACVRTWIT